MCMWHDVFPSRWYEFANNQLAEFANNQLAVTKFKMEGHPYGLYIMQCERVTYEAIAWQTETLVAY
jgi:hypothetical protein